MTKARDLADLLDSNGNLIAKGVVDGRDLATDGSKLDGIEAAATADQDHSEIRALIAIGVDTNVFTDADHTKLNAIEASATADQTDAEIRAAVEAATNSNVFTDADHTKLNAIEAGATADQTKSDIDALNINADTLDGQHGSYYTGYTDTAVANIVDSSPAALNTLNELAAALGDDPNFATAISTSVGTKLPKSGGAMTGAITTSSTFDGRNVSVDGAKLDGIEASADVTDTVNVVAALTAGSNITIASDGTIAGAAQYTHPTHAGDDAAIDTGALSGATVISDLDLNITTDTLGHVTDANATVATRNLTLGDLGYTGATNANYITNNNQITNGAGYTTSVGDITGVTAGSGITGGGTSGTVTVSHADTSSQGSVNNSGSTFIQDVTVDTYGHITGLTSAAVPASGMSKTSTLVSSSGTQSTQVDLSNDLKGSQTTFQVGAVPFGDFFMTGQLPSNNRLWTFDPNTTSSSLYGSFNVAIAAGGVTSVQYKSGVILLAYYSSVLNTTTALAKMLNQAASNQYTQPPAIALAVPSGEIGTGDYFVVAAGRMINGGGYASYESNLGYASNKVTIVSFTQGLS